MEVVIFAAGVVFGVIADRLWSRVERLPQFKLTFGIFDNVSREEGFAYTVKNVGAQDIPEYEIALFHPDRGSLITLHSSDSGPLTPRQERRHRTVLLKHGRFDDGLRSWFYHVRDASIEELAFEGFCFRIVMAKSDRILFESSTIGNALAEQFVRVFETRKIGQMTFAQATALGTPRPTGAQKWLFKLMETVGLRQRETEHILADVAKLTRDAT